MTDHSEIYPVQIPISRNLLPRQEELGPRQMEHLRTNPAYGRFGEYVDQVADATQSTLKSIAANAHTQKVNWS